MASKHLDMCGCTARGSLVCDRISNSSSLDKKKNLGTANEKPNLLTIISVRAWDTGKCNEKGGATENVSR